MLLSAAFVATIGLGPPADRDVPTGAGPLAAATRCPATVRPGDVVVGLRDVPVRFAVSSWRCDVTGWSLDWPAAAVQLSDDVPAAVIQAARLRDTDAGRSALSATLGLADASSGWASVQVRLRHRTTWGSSPRPQGIGPGRRAVRLRAWLGRAWWAGGRYVGLPGRPVRILHRGTGAAGFVVVAMAVTGRGGRLSVRVPGRGPGMWRLQFAGDATDGPATATIPSP